MIRSMTGYGKAEIQTSTRTIIIEVRSLNSKQLDLSLRLPHIFRPMEFEVRQRITRAVQRGKTDFYVNFDTAGNAAGAINAPMFDAFYDQLEQLSSLRGQSLKDNTVAHALAMTAVLRMPEVVSMGGEEPSEEDQKVLLQGVDIALANLDTFRAQEGRELMRDILSRVDRIMELKNSVEPYEKPRVDAYRNRIRENIASMNIPVDSNRLEQEMIFYIEKLDITEEKVRLENHCRYFREVAASEDAPGRKLGFIAQEMGREINTLGSKAADSTIQKTVVEMKDELEKIKEQILNIL